MNNYVEQRFIHLCSRYYHVNGFRCRLWAIAKSFYQAKIDHLMIDVPNFYAAILFYLYCGFNCFCNDTLLRIAKLDKPQDVSRLIWAMHIFDICFSQFIHLKRWSIGLSIIDVCWGIFITTISACVGKLLFDFIAFQ